MNNPKIDQLRIGFLTEKINLTSKEAEKFWPLYNEYRKELQMTQGKTRLKIQEIKLSIGSSSDKELEELADELIELKFKEAEISRKFYPKFKGVLPIEKVLKFYQAEEEFPRWVLKQIRQNQGTPPNRMNRNK